jgi:hypothetical protein
MAREPDANVFVAAKSHASASGASDAMADGITGARFDGIDADSVAALHYSLLRRDYETDGIDLNVLGSHDEVFAYDKLHGGWLFQFPDEIVAKLASLTDDAMDETASRWSRIFENRGQRLRVDELRSIVRQLRSLAASASQTGQSLYWVAPNC